MRYQVAVTFAIDGDLRFLSHLDALRLFARAIARAGLPIRFSEGFNPQPRLRLPLPRPVGMAADEEMLVIELTEPVDVEMVGEKLRPQLPEGIRLMQVRPWINAGVPQAAKATYRLGISPEDCPRLTRAAAELLSADHLRVARSYGPGKPARAIDIRNTINRILVETDHLEFVVSVRPEGSARAVEVVAALGLDPAEAAHRIRRVGVEWSNG